MFLFSEKRAAALIEEALLNERLAAFLMKNYETDDLATNDICRAPAGALQISYSQNSVNSLCAVERCMNP